MDKKIAQINSGSTAIGIVFQKLLKKLYETKDG
jgi:hypothetical protein